MYQESVIINKYPTKEQQYKEKEGGESRWRGKFKKKTYSASFHCRIKDFRAINLLEWNQTKKIMIVL